ncbi:MAG: DUF4199 domain-containing protein [Leeuwenhoekiella sp.]
MENKTNSFKNIAFTNGVLLAASSIVILVLMYVLNLPQEWYISIISMAITIYLIATGITSLKKSQGGYISLVESLKMGMAIAAIAGVIGGLFAFIHYTFIYPEFIDTALEQSREQTLKFSPDLSDEDLEKSMEFSRMVSTPFVYATISLIGTIFIGFIISLITGLVVKKEDPYAQQ